MSAAGLAEPVAELDRRYSSPGAAPTSWPDALAILSSAELYWISTVRPDGRPHVTPLAAVVDDGTIDFDVRDGAFHSDDGGHAFVFDVRARQGFGFGKGDAFSQTRWRFPG